MEFLLLAVIILFIMIFVKIAMIDLKLTKSNYKQSSGNGLWNILFNNGNYGEFLTYTVLESCNEKNILCNIYLPKANNKTTEVDLISINKKGIFVYESKNYSGWIFGDEKSKNWTQCLKGGKKNKFFNPIFQNKGHITAIDNYLDNSFSTCFLSYIVFSERCELKKVTVSSEKVKVMNRYSLKKILTQDMNTLPDVLTDEQVNMIYDKLKANTLVDKSIKQKHIDDIKARLS